MDELVSDGTLDDETTYDFIWTGEQIDVFAVEPSAEPDATPEGPGQATAQADSSDEPAYTSTLTPESTTSIQAAYCNVGEVERMILSHIQEVIYFCVVYGRYLSDGTLVFSNVISVELNIYPYWNSHGYKMRAWTQHSNGVFSGVVSLHRMNGILPPEWMNSVRWDKPFSDLRSDDFVPARDSREGKFTIEAAYFHVRDNANQFDRPVELRSPVVTHRFQCVDDRSGSPQCEWPNGQEAPIF